MTAVLLSLATLVAVGLMVAVLVRMGKRYDALHADFERLKVVQRDMSTDVRTRLDEGSKTWERVESEVQPKLRELEALEPSVADLSAALEENLPALSEARKRLDEVEARAAGTESRVTAALEASAADAGERFERIEEAVRTLRNAADERLADVAARVSALEEVATAPVADDDDDEPVLVSAGAASTAGSGAVGAPPPIPGSSSRGATSPREASRGTGSSGRGSGASGRGAGAWVLIVLAVLGGVVALIAALDN